MTRRSAIAAGFVIAVGSVAAWSVTARAQVAPAAADRIAVGDWQITPVAELRIRGELWRDLDQENHGVLVERARVGLDALYGPIEARVTLQDARALDLAATAAPIVGPGTASGIGAYEAWAEAHTDSSRPSFVRVGRQPITWGEGRLLGADDWTPAGRSLDAVRGRLVAGDGSFELLAAALTDPPTSASLDAYGELLGARSEWSFDPLFGVEAYVLVRLAQEDPVASLGDSVRGETYTGSLRLHGDAFGWSWGAEGAYQIGRAANLGLARAAWAGAAHVAYTFEEVALRPFVRVGVSYASGDAGGSTYRAFDPLLPDVHVWHGAMDLFTWSNEEEVNARVACVPWTDAVAAVEYRYAALPRPEGAWRSGYLTTIGSAPGNTHAGLGQEMDAMLRWSPWEPLALEAGYSLFLLGAGARAILAENAIGRPQGSGTVSTASVAHFAYAQATLDLP